MKAGRNDPCPCGSGKKYKKCCLAKDQEASLGANGCGFASAVVGLLRLGRAPSSPSSIRSLPGQPHRHAPRKLQHLPEPPDPVTERGDSRWREFKSQNGEARIAVFLETLEDAEVMNDELAFEMLGILHTDAVKSGSRTRFAECVDALRERRPEVFDESAHYYLSWCLQDALAESRQEVVPSLARELAAPRRRDIDTFNRAREALAYHGQLAVLVEALRIAWPFVKSSDNIVPWGISEFAKKAVNHEIFDYLENTASPDPADPVLLDRVQFFIEEPREEYLREFIDDLTGKSGREWQADDFALRPPRKRRRDDWDDEQEEATDPGPGRDQSVPADQRVRRLPTPRGRRALPTGGTGKARAVSLFLAAARGRPRSAPEHAGAGNEPRPETAEAAPAGPPTLP